MSWDKGPGLLNKVTIPCPKNSSLNLLACHEVSRTRLDSVTEELTVLLFWGKISIFIHLVIHRAFESCSEPGPAELTLVDPAQTSLGPQRLSWSHALPTPFSASTRTPQVFKHTAMSSPACEPCEDLEQMQNGAQKM